MDHAAVTQLALGGLHARHRGGGIILIVLVVVIAVLIVMLVRSRRDKRQPVIDDWRPHNPNVAISPPTPAEPPATAGEAPSDPPAPGDA